MTIKIKDTIDAIKQAGKVNGILTYQSLRLKTDKLDAKAIEIIESLGDYSFGDGIEALQDAIFWLIFINSSNLAAKEKGIQTEITIRRKSQMEQLEEIKLGMTKKAIILNSKFEEAKKWTDASYAIYDNNEIEFYASYDTVYPIITAEEIQKLAEILKRKEKRKTSIQIFLHVYDKWGIDSLDTEVLEDLEDSIRDLLQSKGFSKFNIEDGYTGNSTTAHGGEEEQ